MKQEKWYWTDLGGFDADNQTASVADFINRVGGDIRGVSLLFSDIDFINCHNPDPNETLRAVDCTYGGHPGNLDRARQAWTRRGLQALVKALQARGVSVLLSTFNVSFFNVCANPERDGKIIDGAHSGAHPELWEADAAGARSRFSMNVLKRLPDKTYYQDYLAAKLKEAVEFYGFDGMQVADGLSSARMSIQNGDFSDDMFAQFTAAAGCEIPEVPFLADHDNALYKKRRAWILENRLYDWTVFLSGRWADFYRVIFAALPGKILIFNNAWTREPFEALYRYGFDYRKAYKKEAYGMMTEDTSPTAAIYSRGDMHGVPLSAADRAYCQNELGLVHMSLKIAQPGVKQLYMTPIRDTLEDYDSLRHATMDLERSILRRNNSFVFDGKAYVPYADGPWYCLSDGVPAEDWRFLFARENKRIESIEGTLGVAAVWSDAALYPELKHYIQTNDYTSTELRKEFLNAGLPISTMVRFSDIEKISEPLLVTCPQFLSADEIKILERTNKTMIVAGKENPLKRKADAYIGGGILGVWLYNAGAAAENFRGKSAAWQGLAKVQKCAPGVYADYGGIWTCPLKYNRVSADFFRAIAHEFNQCFGLPYAESEYGGAERDCTVITLRTGKSSYRVLMANNGFSYIVPKIVFPFPVAAARSLNKPPLYKVRSDGNVAFNRIPPRGIDILAVEAANESK